MYEDVAPAVLGYFRAHRMRDPEALTGDVFVRVTEKLDTFSGDDDALRRWVFTIAHNRRVDEIRRASNRPEVLTDHEWIAVADDGVDVDPLDRTIDPALLAALARLTADQRDVVVLRFVADLPLKVVAQIVGRRTGAVKMLQARALESLAADLGAGGDPEAGGGALADVDEEILPGA